jgi:putative peptidoglycan lipid II flippase
MSKTYAVASREEYSKLLDWGLRLCLLLALPSAIALAIISEPLIASLFQYGKFTAEDTLMTQRALIAYSLGLVGIILVKILAPAFYAQQNIKTPVRIGLVTLLATQAMNVLFVFVIPLAHAGLALAIGLAACLNAALLYWQLRKRDMFQPQPGWALFAGKLLLALLAMAAALLVVMQQLPAWGDSSMLWRLLRLGMLVGVGLAAYFAVLAMLGFRVRHFSRRSVH